MCLHGMGFIFLDRNWNTDEKKLHSGLASLQSEPIQPFWLLIFPEGHRMSASKLEDSNAFAKKKDLPQLKNVMFPRVKGFSVSYLQLSKSIDAVYDLTLAHTKTPDYFWKLLSGAQQVECHMLIRRFELKSIPKDEKALSEFLFQLFIDKEKAIEAFKRTGKFDAPIISDPLPVGRILSDTFKFYCLVAGSLTITYLVYHIILG